MDITARIESLIKEKGYNKSQFAEKLGTQRQNLNNLIKSPSFPTLEKIAEALDIPLWQLFKDGDDDMPSTLSITCPYCGHELSIDIK